MKKFKRRKFIVVTALAAGYAACVRPISSQTVETNAAGLVAGEVQIPVADGEIPAYRAMPESDASAPFPTVLVIQEIFGVHEYIQDVCRRFAKLGYLAIAPELFARQGDVSQLTEVRQIIDQVVSKVPDQQVMSDLDAALAWAEKTGQADITRTGITGFCWGGRITWLYAAHNPQIQAGVAWYGRLVGNYTDLTPKHPVDIAADLTVPVLGLYGGEDDGIPIDTVQQMRRQLREGESGSEILVYPDAPHGFHADYRPTYRPETAKDGWQRLQAWFSQHGAV